MCPDIFPNRNFDPTFHLNIPSYLPHYNLINYITVLYSCFP